MTEPYVVDPKCAPINLQLLESIVSKDRDIFIKDGRNHNGESQV